MSHDENTKQLRLFNKYDIGFIIVAGVILAVLYLMRWF